MQAPTSLPKRAIDVDIPRTARTISQRLSSQRKMAKGFGLPHPESNPLRVLWLREQMIVAASWRPKNAEKFHAFGHLPHRADRRHPGGLVLPWLGVRRKPMASHQPSDGTHENGHHGSLSPDGERLKAAAEREKRDAAEFMHDAAEAAQQKAYELGAEAK